MSRPRAISEQQAIELEVWYRELERVGTFSAKARELGVTRLTLRDTIRRVRGQDTQTIRRKLSALEMEQLVNQILREDVSNGDAIEAPRETNQTGEEQLTTTG